MPILVKFMFRHALVGYALAIVFVAALLALDIGGIAGLMRDSSSGILALGLLIFFTGLTFASLQMGIAIMSLRPEREEDDPDDHVPGVPTWEEVPVRAVAKTSKLRSRTRR